MKKVAFVLGIVSGAVMIYLSINAPELVKEMVVGQILRATIFICGVALILSQIVSVKKPNSQTGVKIAEIISALLAILTIVLLLVSAMQNSLDIMSWAIFTGGTAAVIAVFNSWYKAGKYKFSWIRIMRVALLGFAVALLVGLTLGKYAPFFPPSFDAAVGGVAGFLTILLTSQTKVAS